MGINIDPINIIETQSNKQEPVKTQTQVLIQANTSSLLDEPINENELNQMLGITEFGTSKSIPHASVEHCLKHVKPNRKFKQRTFKNVGMAKNLPTNIAEKHDNNIS